MAQRRPGEHLCPALRVPRVRLPAGDEQRGLARDAEVRLCGARPHRLRAVAGAARPRRALRQLLTRHTTACRAGTFAVSSWSKVRDQGVTSLAVLFNGVCSRSECGLLPSLCVCASFCPISYHKSIGGRSSSATSSRRRSTGSSRRVAAASRRSGRSARRAGPREARFVHVVDLVRQSRAMVFAWWNPCIIRTHCAADGGAGESFAAGPALQLSLFQETSDWPPFVLLCRAADVQRSGPERRSGTHEAV